YEMNPSDVLIYPSETIQASRDIRTGKIIPQSVHMFQKPLSLMNHLVRKHSYPGELIVDCFGCSGSCCIAANSLGRRWLYIESNKNNFLWGAQRIMSSIKEYTASHLVG
ncbi:MAG TPA: DNA methyltransferase, partial [Phycisphaerae bacterium]|nr:DNA methyltransferase [Phycisphaerae bacterium]